MKKKVVTLLLFCFVIAGAYADTQFATSDKIYKPMTEQGARV